MKRLTKLIELTGGEPLAVDPSSLERAYGDRKPYAVVEGIAVIDIAGPLMKQPSLIDEWFDGATAYGQIQAEVGDAATDDNIRAILLRINSPGGEVSGMFETAADIEAAAELKPVWAVADDTAASAAYLLMASASTIYVPGITGEVGSIGIIARHFDYSKMLEKAGIDVTTVFAGARKNDFSPYEPLSKSAREILEARIEALYGKFISAVADNRGMKTSAVRGTEAGMFIGQEAVDIGLADKIGAKREALADLKEFLQPAASAAVTTTPRQEGRMPEAQKPDATDKAPDIKQIKADAVKAGFDAAAEIVDLCALAGKPDQAGEFIKARKPAADVRAELLEARAKESEAEDVSSNITAEAGANSEADEKALEQSTAERMKARIAAQNGGK